MEPITAAATGMKAINDAIGVARALLDMNLQAKVQTLVIDLNKKVLDAQAATQQARDDYTTLRDANKQLTERIRQLEQAQADKENYELTNLGSGAFVYVSKPTMQPSQQTHWLCAYCLDRSIKSILQNQGASKTMYGAARFHCFACKSDIMVDYDSAAYQALDGAI